MNGRTMARGCHAASAGMKCLTWVLVLAPLAGCHTLPGEPLGDPLDRIPNVTYDEPVGLYHDIAFWTKPLPRAVPVRAMRVERLPEGHLRVVIEVRNNTGKELRIDYKVRFLDRSGVELEGGPWTHRILAARIEEQISFNSISVQAADWRFHVRWAR